MSSSRIDDARPAATPRGQRAGAGRDSHRRWFKRLLPRTLYGRSLIIIILPLVIAQLLATWIFYDRHWNEVQRRLATSVAGDIAVTLEAMRYADNQAELDALFARTTDSTELFYMFRPGERLPKGVRESGDSHLEEALAAALADRVRRPFQIDADFDPRDVLISIELPDGVMQVAAPFKRLFTPTTYIFVLWMAGSSLVLLAIASLFMRNQVRALRRLADAAESFGKGRDVANFKLEGATEVRQAATAFLKMRDRIKRQITQRTEMLAGVSHDLRTPLTRMRLAFELLGEDGPAVEELKTDVQAMERMVEGYLDFARGEGAEQAEPVNLSAVLEDVAAGARRAGAAVRVEAPPALTLPLRADAVR
ncbi:MAG TPA: histidine kinase dimerization/phospho-acceptor domain-containing protein, partial [Stellaceae bacterium]